MSAAATSEAMSIGEALTCVRERIPVTAMRGHARP